MVYYFSINEIINISLIGLGLILALYTIISDRINDLQKSRSDSFQDAVKAIKESDLQTRGDIKEIKKKLKRIKSGMGYHYNLGYFISGILFVAPIFVIFLISFFFDAIPQKLLLYLQISVFAGLINFFIVWFRTMFDMRALFRDKTEIVEGIEKEKKKKSGKK